MNEQAKREGFLAGKELRTFQGLLRRDVLALKQQTEGAAERKRQAMVKNPCADTVFAYWFAMGELQAINEWLANH